MSTAEEHLNEESPTPQVAPLWRRAAADAVDFALLGVVLLASLLLGAVTGFWWIVVPLCFAARVAAIYHCPPSPGKRALGLHLTRGDRTPCTRREMLGFDLLQLPAVGKLLLTREPRWKTSVAFDGEWRRTARDHLENTFLVHCPELSGEVRDPTIDYAAVEAERQREKARRGAETVEPKAPPGQRWLFTDEELADAEEAPPGLLARTGTVHAASVVDGGPLCGTTKGVEEMTPTDQEITCKRCLARPGKTSKSKKGADAA